VKDDRALLLHILDAAARIDEYTQGGRVRFLADPRTQDAVIRNIEIVGEAAKGLSEQTKSRQAEIPWRQIAGMRDKLIHQYFGVNLELVWKTVEVEIPRLAEAVKKLLGSGQEQ
jgi:uncharacterized protein with HEPN domain